MVRRMQILLRFGTCLQQYEDEGTAHIFELSELAKKDPEFYKYLQENDRELLEFNPDDDNLGSDDDDEGEDVDMDETQEIERAPVLTKKELQRWQKSLLEVFDHLLLKFGVIERAGSTVHSGRGENL